MIICAISDSHKQRPALPKADLLIHAGDIGSGGSFRELMAEIEWLASLKPQFPKGIIFVPGNHDIAFDEDFARAQWEQWVADPYHNYKPKDGDTRLTKQLIERTDELGIELLLHEPLEVDGIKIFGSPYTPIFYDWAFMHNENGLANRYQEIPDDTQLLITHGPGYGLRDMCGNGHVGSTALRWVVDTRLPDLKAHIFGHIHEGAGWHQERYLCWNAAVLDGRYMGTNPIYTMDTADWKIREPA